MDDHESLAAIQEIVYEEFPLPEETESEVYKNKQLLCDNLTLFLANADTIISTPEYFYVRH